MSNVSANGRGGQPRPRKYDSKKTKLKNSPFWVPLLRTLREPMVIPAYIRRCRDPWGRKDVGPEMDLVTGKCLICGRKSHNHGYTGEAIGSLQPTLSHCTSAPGVPILLKIMGELA